MRRTYIGIFIIGILVLGALIYGFSTNASPFETRRQKLDDQRIEDILALQSQIDSYYAKNNRLPLNLKEIGDEGLNLTDPETKKPYIYKPGENSKYKLCATFSAKSPVENKSPYSAYGTKFKHPKGDYCFDLSISEYYLPIEAKIQSKLARLQLDDCKGGIAKNLLDSSNYGRISIGPSGAQTATGDCESKNDSSAWSNGSEGKFGGSLFFDGIDDYLTLGDSLLANAGEYTISAWVKTTDTENVRRIVHKGQFLGSNGYGFILRKEATGLPALYGEAGCVVTGKSRINDGLWHNVVGVQDSNQAKLYVDGVLESTCNGWNTITSTNELQISGYNNGSGEVWQGQIDEVRIYNYALTTEQVKEVYGNTY